MLELILKLSALFLAAPVPLFLPFVNDPNDDIHFRIEYYIKYFLVLGILEFLIVKFLC